MHALFGFDREIRVVCLCQLIFRGSDEPLVNVHEVRHFGYLSSLCLVMAPACAHYSLGSMAASQSGCAWPFCYPRRAPRLATMEYRQLGKSGLRVSTVTLGTMGFGGTGWATPVGQ